MSSENSLFCDMVIEHATHRKTAGVTGALGRMQRRFFLEKSSEATAVNLHVSLPWVAFNQELCCNLVVITEDTLAKRQLQSLKEDREGKWVRVLCDSTQEGWKVQKEGCKSGAKVAWYGRICYLSNIGVEVFR